MNVIGQINYIDRHTPAPTTYYVDPPAGMPVDSVVIDPQAMPITDLRTVSPDDDLFFVQYDATKPMESPAPHTAFTRQSRCRRAKVSNTASSSFPKEPVNHAA